MKKLTNEEVIEKLKSLYGDSLDYTKVLYVNSRNPITLICPKHGEFSLYANNALQGKGGCPKCKLGIATLEEFIEESKKIFGDKFTYEKTLFKNLSEKVIITCPIHGDFEIVPNHFLHSVHGCKKCYADSRKVDKIIPEKESKETKRLLKYNQWIGTCKIIHNNKYDYSKVVYNGKSQKVCIICPEHGEFYLTPSDHERGRGCPKCGYIERAAKTRISQQEFEKRAFERWGGLYSYGTYNGAHKNIEITCPIHGIFYATPHNHLKDCGCPKCSMSSGELLIYNFLEENNIKYIPQYLIEIDKSINSTGIAKIDFYLLDLNIFIEYNGILHYIPVEHFGGLVKYEQLVLRDNYIREYCKNNNIKLIEISYKLSPADITKILNNINNGKIQEKTFGA